MGASIYLALRTCRRGHVEREARTVQHAKLPDAILAQHKCGEILTINSQNQKHPPHEASWIATVGGVRVRTTAYYKELHHTTRRDAYSKMLVRAVCTLGPITLSCLSFYYLTSHILSLPFYLLRSQSTCYGSRPRELGNTRLPVTLVRTKNPSKMLSLDNESMDGQISSDRALS